MDFNNYPNSKEIKCENISELIDYVFSQPPAPPRSYELKSNDFSNSHDIFKCLGQILTHGIVYKYGEDITADSMSPLQIQTMQQYINSFGWKVIINPTKNLHYPQALPYILKLPSVHDEDVAIIFEPLPFIKPS